MAALTPLVIHPQDLPLAQALGIRPGPEPPKPLAWKPNRRQRREHGRLLKQQGLVKVAPAAKPRRAEAVTVFGK